MSGIGHVVSKVVVKNFVTNVRYMQWGYRRCLFQQANRLSVQPDLSKEDFRHGNHAILLSQVRHLSQPGKKGKFVEILDNIKSEMNKNKEMKENLKRFRDEADKLEQSEALKKAREKYEKLKQFGSEADRLEQSEAVKKAKEAYSELAERGQQFADEFSKTAQKAAETVSKGTEQISQNPIFKSVSQGVKAVKEEIDDVALHRGRLYKPPAQLRKREEHTFKSSESRPIEANEDATGVTLHKDSKFYQSWQSFKDNNQFVTKLFDMKMKYDESDNIFIRATRTFTDKVTDIFGGVFSKTEMSEVLTEIVKMDPNFDKEKFIHECQYELIPNILEAIVRGELDILKDWCHEAVYNTIAHPIEQTRKAGYIIESKVLDINNVDIAAGKMMEHGPVLVFTFSAQQITVVRDAKGNIKEGDPDKILRVFNVWAFCRDQTILDPKAAWRLIDMSSNPMEQFL